LTNGTFSSNNADNPTTNGLLLSGIGETENDPQSGADDEAVNGLQGALGSPDDDMDSLFGDNDAGLQGSALPGLGDDEDDEFSRAIANGLQQQAEDDPQGDVNLMDDGGPVRPAESTLATPMSPQPAEEAAPNGVLQTESQPQVNGLPHSEELLTPPANGLLTDESNPSSETTFLSASIDGSIRVWDCRQSNPIARIQPPRGTPHWCMSACWSPDGNFIYAGRRNNCVDEYSFHKGLHEPQRTFRFPAGSGPVSAVRAMPNGRHIIW
jgi:transcriptional activator SPT8